MATTHWEQINPGTVKMVGTVCVHQQWAPELYGAITANRATYCGENQEGAIFARNLVAEKGGKVLKEGSAPGDVDYYHVL